MDYFALLVISVIVVAPSMLLIAGILFIASKIKDKKKPTLAKKQDSMKANMQSDQMGEMRPDPMSDFFEHTRADQINPLNSSAFAFVNDDH